MLVTTTERLIRAKYEVLGECFGVTTQSRDIIISAPDLRTWSAARSRLHQDADHLAPGGD